MKLIALLAVAAVLRAQEDNREVIYYAQRFKSLQDDIPCTTLSPQQELTYGQNKVTDVRGIFFCDQYAKRTCCSEDNFNDVKKRYPLVLYVIDGSASTRRQST
jgi:hypothetical protein